MALISSLSSSLTGMKVAQSQLEIISNNIANVDTAGYTRKTAAQSALVSAGQTMGAIPGEALPRRLSPQGPVTAQPFTQIGRAHV